MPRGQWLFRARVLLFIFCLTEFFSRQSGILGDGSQPIGYFLGENCVIVALATRSISMTDPTCAQTAVPGVPLSSKTSPRGRILRPVIPCSSLAWSATRANPVLSGSSPASLWLLPSGKISSAPFLSRSLNISANACAFRDLSTGNPFCFPHLVTHSAKRHDMQHSEKNRDERIVGKRCFRGHRNTTRNEPPYYQRINQRVLMIDRDQ